MELISLLKNIYLFKGLTDLELKKLERIVVKHEVRQGSTLFWQGDDAEGMFVIAYGTIQMLYKGEESDSEEFLSLGSGAHFGELPFLDGMKRQLTARPLENSVVYEIPFDRLRKLLEEDTKMAADFYQALAHFLSARLRQLSNEMIFLKEQGQHHHR
ncbi:MAG: cyclic nucleotide-binding domain-containing protein [Spirochaetales bacterium]|nr:cyclic nucleotide-binding domain-containing protein [Leptospiraceae bacterium]MCP5481055.1 cyclic nucleotide-binding domain-containing protein [Spirochaetales bacterium]MCP5485435.1 cyclic nucleotide-binding domain-containing protein [Spirochaetales bacterium]